MRLKKKSSYISRQENGDVFTIAHTVINMVENLVKSKYGEEQ